MAQYKAHDHIDIAEQAELAADFYLRRGPGPIYVFPTKRTGNSVDFRMFLSSFLLHGAMRPYDKHTLAAAEKACANKGYPFIEVDSSDYPAR